MQIGPPQVSTTQVGMAQVCTNQVGPPQVSTTQVGPPQVSTTQVGTFPVIFIRKPPTMAFYDLFQIFLFHFRCSFMQTHTTEEQAHLPNLLDSFRLLFPTLEKALQPLYLFGG